MKHVGLSNISDYLELNQVGLLDEDSLWAHKDPKSDDRVRLVVFELRLNSLSRMTYLDHTATFLIAPVKQLHQRYWIFGRFSTGRFVIGSNCYPVCTLHL